MKVAIFDTHAFEKGTLCEANEKFQFDLTFFDVKLNEKTATLAQGFPCVAIFANDRPNRETLTTIAKGGTRLLALRSAGFNHVDLEAAKELGIKVVRVPEYSPYSVAEHAVGLILSLNRKIPKAVTRVRDANFSLEGLVGFDLHGKTVGVIGMGKIGKAFVRIMRGFGCHVLVYDLVHDDVFQQETGCNFASLDDVIAQSDIISLHIPLTPETFHIIDKKKFHKMKKGVMFINTSRGGLVDTKALINELKSGHLGYAGLDVYEEEANYFFEDQSDQIMNDEVLLRLMTFPNVILTSHQGFLTREALSNIASTTMQNIHEFNQGLKLTNEV